MARKRTPGAVPQPPWTFAPSEVADWMASTAGSSRAPPSRSRPQVRIKGFVGRGPTSAERKLVRRLADLRFERTDPIPAAVREPLGRPENAAFVGAVGETTVRIRLRSGTDLDLRIDFHPRITFRRASKLVSRLGLRGFEGRWI